MFRNFLSYFGFSKYNSQKRDSAAIENNATEEEIHHQQFIRNTAFFGEEGQKRIENAFVIIVGLGGVGSHTAHMLARSGVNNLQFIDFDIVTVSSLNRHSVATRKDIGKKKVEVMRDHILDFNPSANISTCNIMLSKDNIESVITKKPDFIVDCIDDFTTKTDLLEYCIYNDINVISSMGSGCRSNTTSVLITNITDVKYDPLAAKIRFNLKKRKIDFDSTKCVNPCSNADPMKKMVVNVDSGVYIPCVSSYEKPVTRIMSYDASKDAKKSEDDLTQRSSNESVVQIEGEDTGGSAMRYRCIPVYACVPAAFGNTICSYILHSLSQKTFKPSVVVPLSQDVLMKMYNRLLTKEKSLFGNTDIPVDRFDLMFLVQQVYKQKCVFSDSSIAGSKLEFTRWDLKKAPTLDNIVLGTAEECKKHEKEGLEGMDAIQRKRIQGIIDRNVSYDERNRCYF